MVHVTMSKNIDITSLVFMVTNARMIWPIMVDGRSNTTNRRHNVKTQEMTHSKLSNKVISTLEIFKGNCLLPQPPN